MSRRSKHLFHPSVESLEGRDLVAAWLPGALPTTSLVRWTVVGRDQTAADRNVIAAVLADVARGNSLRFRYVAGMNQADATFFLNQGSIDTNSTVRHGPGQHGLAAIRLPGGIGKNPLAWVKAIGHEVLHALGFVHTGWSASSPPLSQDEKDRLYAYGASIGWDRATVEYQWFGPRPGVLDDGYDAASLMNNPIVRAFPQDDGLLSRGDRAALSRLIPR